MLLEWSNRYDHLREVTRDDEIDLAYQLLASLDLRATTINAAIAALIRDAGNPSLDHRIHTLRTEPDMAALTSMTPTLELAAAFHQAVLDDHDALAATLSRLREHTQNGDYAYYIDIASFMAGLPLLSDHTRRTGWTASRPPTPDGARSSPPASTASTTTSSSKGDTAARAASQPSGLHTYGCGRRTPGVFAGRSPEEDQLIQMASGSTPCARARANRTRSIVSRHAMPSVLPGARTSISRPSEQAAPT
ncbi:hypothetical protein AAW14_24805 [Streptomyces hygroscopicus]|uniref:hypothetical protein n=1 Tax=Streptomyces hygroscopicus TaxID=1912 RepID=UPI0022402736|nr:hypothetical protein [Streptomyces hygroscopicus]MCW7945144.1 hypothetical protein [Streptomyces hygroscopicus]